MGGSSWKIICISKHLLVAKLLNSLSLSLYIYIYTVYIVLDYDEWGIYIYIARYL